MGNALPPKEAALYRRVDEVLYYVWDPIRVSRSAGARDEYQSYLPKMFQLVKERAAVEDFVAYLNEAREHMGLKKAADHDANVAKLLLEIREKLS